MDKENPDKLQKLSDFVKPIFIKWEKLRPVYNGYLLGVILLSGQGWGVFVNPLLLLVWLIGAVLANIVYLAGPVSEAYIAWLGLRSNYVTAVLFFGGLLVSIPCVLLFFPLVIL